MSHTHNRSGPGMVLNNRAPFTPPQNQQQSQYQQQPSRPFNLTPAQAAQQQQQAPGTPPVVQQSQQQTPNRIPQQQQPPQTQSTSSSSSTTSSASSQNINPNQHSVANAPPTNPNQQTPQASFQQSNQQQQSQPALIQQAPFQQYGQTDQTGQSSYVPAAYRGHPAHNPIQVVPHQMGPNPQYYYNTAYLPQAHLQQQFATTYDASHYMSYPVLYNPHWNQHQYVAAATAAHQLQSQQPQQNNSQQQQQNNNNMTTQIHAHRVNSNTQQSQQQQPPQPNTNNNDLVVNNPANNPGNNPNYPTVAGLPNINQQTPGPIYHVYQYAPQMAPAGVVPGSNIPLVSNTLQQQQQSAGSAPNQQIAAALQQQQVTAGTLPITTQIAQAAVPGQMQAQVVGVPATAQIVGISTSQQQQPTQYQKRERKPLLIIDPTTKQIVNANAVKTTTTTNESNNSSNSNTSNDVKSDKDNKTTTTNKINETNTSNTNNSSSNNNKVVDKKESTPTPTTQSSSNNKPNDSNNITVKNNETDVNKQQQQLPPPPAPTTTAQNQDKTTQKQTGPINNTNTTTTTTTPTPTVPFSYSQVAAAQAVPKSAIVTAPANKQINNNNQSKTSNTTTTNTTTSNNTAKPIVNENNNKQQTKPQSDSQQAKPVVTVQQSATSQPAVQSQTQQSSTVANTTTTTTITTTTADVPNNKKTIEPNTNTDNQKPTIATPSSSTSETNQLNEKLSQLDINKKETDKKPTMTAAQSTNLTMPTPNASTTTTTTAPIQSEPINKLNDNNNNIDPKSLPTKTDETTNKAAVSSATSSAITTTTTTSSDRWTPENKQGKKRYDREFLLSFRDKKLSNILPDAIKNNPDLILQDQNSGQHQKQQQYGNYDFNNQNPNIRSRSNYGGMDGQTYGKGSGQKIKQRGSQTRASQDNRQNVQVISLDRDVPIRNRADNPYQIKRKEERNEYEELLREVRNILNKLTPQNLNKLTSDLINLPINNEERLKSSIDIIFEKSIDEQVFSQTYAQVCRVLSQIKVPSQAEPTKIVSFRTLLLSKCQKEFDTDFYQEINYDKLQAEIESCTDEQKKAELKEQAEEKLSKAKRRSLGNIRFIGELFKLQMLTEGIMNDCIERLLKQESDEENLECLCKLLTTIGKEVDKPNNSQKMKSYFERLDKIVKKKGTKDTVTARIRFMILDVIDLRKNNWVPRRKDNNPRRIEEIRKEAEEEQARLEAEIAKNQALEKARREGQQGGQKGGQKGQFHQHSLKSTSMDSESFRASKAQNGNMASKIKDVKTITTKTSNTELLLGPGGGGGFSWAKPKQQQQQSSATSETTTSLKPSSTFSFPSKSSTIDENRSNPSGTVPSSSSISSSLSQKIQQTSAPTSRLSMDSNKAKQQQQFYNVKKIDSQQSIGTTSESSRASSRDASRDGSNLRDYTQEEIERKALNTAEELIQNKDVLEALKDFDDFKPIDQSQLVTFMEQLISIVLERSDCSRQAIGQLFYNVLKEKKCDVKLFVKSLQNILELAEDMAIDVPKIATYLSQIIAPIFQRDISVEFLLEACEPIRSKRICAEFISEVLHSAANRLGHSTVSDIFKSSNLRIQDFLQGVPNSLEFIKENKIDWIMGTRERTQSASVSTDSFENKLFEILEDPKEKNETIFDKIENEFSDADCNSKPFIRALVMSVCRSCYIDNKIDAAIFKERSSILTHYIARNEDFELEALFAVQALDRKTKHQPGVIRVLCDLLYDEDIIREDVFWKWQQSGKEEGHAISVLSLKGFFEWLSETNDEDSK